MKILIDREYVRLNVNNGTYHWSKRKSDLAVLGEALRRHNLLADNINYQDIRRAFQVTFNIEINERTFRPDRILAYYEAKSGQFSFLRPR